MIVLCTCINMKLGVHLSSERSLGKHSLNSTFNYLTGRVCKSVLKGLFLHSAYIIGVIVIDLLIKLLAGYLNLCSVDNDNIITGVKVGSEDRLILSSQD